MMKLRVIESALNYKIDIDGRQQEFRRSVSLYFAAIVGLLIVGFFSVAWRSQRLTEEIFAGQAGLQFITLFSLVIAIILFGVTGVLEGKELSALLGGLSGYILGRSGGGATPPQPPAGGLPSSAGTAAPPPGSQPPQPAAGTPARPAGTPSSSTSNG